MPSAQPSPGSDAPSDQSVSGATQPSLIPLDWSSVPESEQLSHSVALLETTRQSCKDALALPHDHWGQHEGAYLSAVRTAQACLAKSTQSEVVDSNLAHAVLLSDAALALTDPDKTLRKSFSLSDSTPDTEEQLSPNHHP